MIDLIVEIIAQGVAAAHGARDRRGQTRQPVYGALFHGEPPQSRPRAGSFFLLSFYIPPEGQVNPETVNHL